MHESNGGYTSPDWNSGEDTFYRLRLFVTGTSSISVRAIGNVKEICDQYLKGKYELEIIDIYQQPMLVKDENITAVPMLVQRQPLPKRRLIGDMSDRNKILNWLGVS